jgi:hypothetical protein
MNTLHQAISVLAQQVSFQEARLPQMQSRRQVGTRRRTLQDKPGVFSCAIAQLVEVATLSPRVRTHD